MTRGITKVTFTDEIDCPAAIWMHSGHLLLHPELWGDLPADQRLYVILHELGHAVLLTEDEKAADRWASDQFFNRYNGSPRQSVIALTDGLSFNDPEHAERAMLQLERAFLHDQKLQKMERVNARDMGMADSFQSFLGLGKAAKEKRENRQEQKQIEQQLKNDKKAAQNEVILARAEKKRATADARANREPGQGMAILDKGLGALGAILGKGEDAGKMSGSVEFETGGEPAPAKDNTMLYVGIAVAVVVVIVVLVLVMKKKPTAKA